MNKLLQIILIIIFSGSVLNPAQAAFTSLYAFGDGACTTTDNPQHGSLYYGLRRTNGRTWIEVLAQQQGLIYDASKNNSYYGQYSSVLLNTVNNFTAPKDASTALFVVWVCDADFVSDISTPAWGPPYTGASLSPWNTAINQSLVNHSNIIAALYAKGVRTLVLPNAVDLTKVPQYSLSSSTDRNFVRGRVIYFNTNFLATLNQIKSLHPDLKIYTPDMFSLLDNVMLNAAFYGLTNALYNGQPIDATESLAGAAINGPGTNYIFWDQADPTAKFHSVIADIVQQQISPVQIGQIAPFTGSNRLDLINVPVGQDGFVDNGTNLLAIATWTSMANITSTNTAESVFVPTGVTNGSSQNLPQFSPSLAGDIGPGGTNNINVPDQNYQFYRLRFPYSWRWP